MFKGLILAILGSSAIAAASVAQGPPGGMMGMGRGMHAQHDSATRAQMQVIHELVMSHEKITRTVTNLPNGIRTVTESDDPRIADLIREHVLAMDERVKAGSDPGMPMESPALKALFAVRDRIHTAIEVSSKGIVMKQTSTDPATVALLQEHAAEVSDLAARGHEAMHEAMMKHGGGMMGRGMHHMGTPRPDTARAP
ncbi:MAG TPA: hypothetical protein VFN96_04125 [Gemmatimonadales bacterium]|nr:hypothetical protein [Gemmatimonadales bacterium]